MLEKEQLLDSELCSVNGGADEPNSNPQPAAPIGYVGPYWVYVIQYGDCLSVLAGKFNTTVAQLTSMNGISDPDVIYAGQHLFVPGEKPDGY